MTTITLVIVAALVLAALALLARPATRTSALARVRTRYAAPAERVVRAEPLARERIIERY